MIGKGTEDENLKKEDDDDLDSEISKSDQEKKNKK